MATKKKSRLMERKLFAISQKWEVKYVLKRYKSISKEKILAFAKQAGRSRLKLYKLIADELERRHNTLTES